MAVYLGWILNWVCLEAWETWGRNRQNNKLKQNHVQIILCKNSSYLFLQHQKFINNLPFKVVNCTTYVPENLLPYIIVHANSEAVNQCNMEGCFLQRGNHRGQEGTLVWEKGISLEVALSLIWLTCLWAVYTVAIFQRRTELIKSLLWIAGGGNWR